MRKSRYIITIVFSLTFLFSQSVGSAENTPDSIMSIAYPVSKQTGDSLYISGKFDEAAKVYESVIANKGVASEIYYNLGNCYYKTGDMAHAILYYERALKLDPSDIDTRENLSLAQSKIQDKSNGQTLFFVVAWWNSFACWLSINTFKILGLISFTLLLTSLLIRNVKQNEVVRKYLKYVSCLALFLFVLTTLAALQQHHNSTVDNKAIVISESASVKSSPSETSTDLFTLHSGSRLVITDSSMKEWCEVYFEDGKTGWINKHDIEQI